MWIRNQAGSRIRLQKCWKTAKGTPDPNPTFLIANYSHLVSNRPLHVPRSQLRRSDSRRRGILAHGDRQGVASLASVGCWTTTFGAHISFLSHPFLFALN